MHELLFPHCLQDQTVAAGKYSCEWVHDKAGAGPAAQFSEPGSCRVPGTGRTRPTCSMTLYSFPHCSCLEQLLIGQSGKVKPNHQQPKYTFSEASLLKIKPGKVLLTLASISATILWSQMIWKCHLSNSPNRLIINSALYWSNGKKFMSPNHFPSLKVIFITFPWVSAVWIITS